MYRSLLGVAPASIGWKTIAIRPQLSSKGPAAVNGSVHTIRGTVSVAWTMMAVSGNVSRPVGLAQLDVVIPGGSTGVLELPVSNFEGVTISEGGVAVWEGATFVRGVEGVVFGKASGASAVTLQVRSGAYQFKLTAGNIQ
eukprot:SAG11_NODE_210_length_12303_cov_10.235824_6_plen_140_part_00